MASRRFSFSAGSSGFSSSGGGDAAGDIVFLGLLLTVLVIVLVAFVLIQAVRQVIRGWRQCRGQYQPLRITFVLWCVLVGLAITSGVVLGTNMLPKPVSEMALIVAGTLLVLTSLALVIAARKAESTYRKLFFREPETLVTKVLRRPWWAVGTQDTR